MSFEITNWAGETMGVFLTLDGAKSWLRCNGIRGDAIWDTESAVTECDQVHAHEGKRNR